MKTVVITGTSRGLGRALARRLAVDDGCRIAGCARSATPLAALSEELGPPHRFAAVDVADPAAVESWARGVIDELGPPDLVINNAALINRNAPLWQVPADEMAALLSVNVGGTVSVVRAFLPAMIERRRGVVVNLSSGWGRSTSPQVAPYCATKWAIEGLTRALAQELPAGMAAVPLNPGTIDTEMLRSAYGEAAAGHQSSRQWAERAAPFLLALGPDDNGRPLTVPA